MKKLILPLMVLFLVLMAGCRPLVVPPETSTPPLATTLQGLRLTESVVTPTATLKPTASATATPTRITETPAVTPNIAATVVAIQQPRLYGSYPSPDSKWRAEVVIYECVKTGGVDENAYEQLKLVQATSRDERLADDQLQYCGGLGAFGLAGLFWSPSSRYFYYTNAREGVPDGCGYWERPTIRLDVTSLNKEYLGAGPRSPEGGKIATWQGQELVVWDINEGEIARAPAVVSDAETGPIAWSPDSRALIYVQFASYCPLSGKSHVVRLDLPELKQTLLLESEKPTFGSVSWNVPDELELFDENGKQWRYGFATQQLKPVP
jgi:hypothetical protein